MDGTKALAIAAEYGLEAEVIAEHDLLVAAGEPDERAWIYALQSRDLI